ncbi:MAG: hypothetical protein M4579_002882 [Chaenotheca gracillima]|nr:MAG: hypothetical protein M4579_002882 [Chaenotheca gracillima]
MASPTASNPLAHMQRLSANVYLQESKSEGIGNSIKHGPSKAAPPNTILLFTWMDAPKRPIAKYVAGYAAHYPSSRIILVTSEQADFMYRTEATQRKRLEPVINAVQADNEARVLVHLFSNGGGAQTCRVAALYRKTTGKLLPFQGLILDSAPGGRDYMSGVRAFSQALPKQFFLRLIGLVAIHLTIVSAFVIGVVFRKESPIARIARNLNDAKLMDPRASRSYIYSESDELVPWQEVEQHSIEAEQKGWIVRREKFQGSTHVGHLRVDERRYWSVVEETWQAGNVST